MKELEDLEQEALEEQLIDVGPIADKLPSVPSAQPAAAARGTTIYSCLSIERGASLKTAQL
jgi:hypothetical protein